MEKNETVSDLRRQAEKELGIRLRDAEKQTELSPEEKDRLLHELQVHQIELEMQNDELRRIQLELETARNRYSDLYDLAPVGYITVSGEGLISEANLTISAMLGVEKSSVIGKPFSRFIASDSQDVYYFHRRKLFKTGCRQICEIELRKQDGPRFYVRLESILAEDAEGKMSPQARTVVTDISAHKQIEEEKKILESQIRQANKMEAIGTLAGGIAHDFNNVLSIIIGNAELASDDLPPSHPAHLNIDEIRKAGMRAADIAKQLLSFTRKTKQNLKPLDAGPVIRDVLRFMRSTIPTTIDIRQNFNATDTFVLADPTQITQVMMNLCTNAFQEMGKTGGILEISVENVVLDEEVAANYPHLSKGRYLRITVSDTGSGINSEIVDKIFDPYFTTKEFGHGSGMGLSVVHGIVKNHGGAITVDSEPGKGTAFNVFFPVVTEKPVRKTEPAGKPAYGNETILLVDDEKSVVKITGRLLERLGYQVETRTDPAEALKLFQSKSDQFDLVITDMTMPHMTGVTLSEKLLEIRKNIPIIICTGHSPLVDEKKARAMGIAAYVMKPVIRQEIARIIRELLDVQAG
ncbi:hypothetical protein DENIS_1532 [Desulfonema ishimotonii]|uniref:histidine kinase n=1 Tax=Desulfonema ishimotonii TaxID=45657 RepID=A0A401FUE4_9BACT|nr:PAS domain-containing sensor histidine kinase [Desulfonema ishimotonii]GBC60575.1 hypothetical protein DENIS_1532 [Desulfonema ishimotonii]